MYTYEKINEDTYYIIDKTNDFIYVLKGKEKNTCYRFRRN